MQPIDHHISDENWRGLMHQARQAAERGEKELLLLRFSSRLCNDAGRAIMRGTQLATTAILSTLPSAGIGAVPR
jgi:hypothetical protein